MSSHSVLRDSELNYLVHSIRIHNVKSMIDISPPKSTILHNNNNNNNNNENVSNNAIINGKLIRLKPSWEISIENNRLLHRLESIRGYYEELNEKEQSSMLQRIEMHKRFVKVSDNSHNTAANLSSNMLPLPLINQTTPSPAQPMLVTRVRVDSKGNDLKHQEETQPGVFARHDNNVDELKTGRSIVGRSHVRHFLVPELGERTVASSLINRLHESRRHSTSSVNVNHVTPSSSSVEIQPEISTLIVGLSNPAVLL